MDLTLLHHGDNGVKTEVITLQLTYVSPSSTARNLVQLHLALLEEIVKDLEKRTSADYVDHRLSAKWKEMMSNGGTIECRKLFKLYSSAGPTPSCGN